MSAFKRKKTHLITLKRRESPKKAELAWEK